MASFPSSFLEVKQTEKEMFPLKEHISLTLTAILYETMALPSYLPHALHKDIQLD